MYRIIFKILFVGLYGVRFNTIRYISVLNCQMTVRLHSCLSLRYFCYLKIQDYYYYYYQYVLSVTNLLFPVTPGRFV